MNHTVDSIGELHESAVSGHIANVTFNPTTDLELLLNLVPRIGFKLSQAERNFLFLLVYPQHDGFNFLQFHECTIRDKVSDLAFDLLAGRETFFDLVPRIPLRLL